MSADWTDIICRKFTAFIYIITDLTSPSNDLLILRYLFLLWFYAILIVGVSKRCILIQQFCICYFCNEQSVVYRDPAVPEPYH